MRYQSSAMCNLLDGSHSRAITRMAAIRSHATSSRPRDSSDSSNSSIRSTRHSVHANHTSPKLRPRSTRTRSTQMRIASAGAAASNRPRCGIRPPIRSARARAFRRPSASSSPKVITVSWRTLVSSRTERTSRQYVCGFPFFLRVVWRRYIGPPSEPYI